METLIDGLTRKDLETRYGITRSNIYNRLSGLKDLGYALTPDGGGLFNADQINLLDQLHAHLQKAGSSIATFPRIDTQQDSPIRQSHRTQDTVGIAIAPTSQSSIEILANLVDVLSHTALAAMHPPADPLAHLGQLERAAEHDWLLTTSEVKGLIGVAPSGERFKRHGFIFIKMGRSGRQMEWKIYKSPPSLNF
jgi:hypothetical protein